MTAIDITRPVGNLAGPLWLAAAAISALVFFEEGIGALLAAWGTAEYSHGPIIPVLSGLMFLRQLKAWPPEPGAVADRWPGVAVLAAALALGFLGKFARIPDVVAYALILWVGGVILVSFGWRRGRHFWPPVLHLCFMLPLPGLLYFKLSTTLQYISSEIGIRIVQLAGVEAYLDGNIISLAGHKLLVAEACSGLRYLFPILSFSYVFAVLYRGPTWHKAVLLLSAAPITVLMNSVRIGLIGVMVEHVGIEHAEGISHLLEGWVVFIVCVAILFGLARLMLALQGTGMTLSEALDLDLSGLRPQLERLRLVQPSVALIVATAMFATSATAWRLAPERAAPEILREPLMFFPLEIAGWRAGPQRTLEPQVLAALGADDYRLISFARAGTAAPVEFFVAWYEDQTQGGIHSPEVCLPGAGWEMAEIGRIDIAEQVGAASSFPVNRAVIQKGVDRLLVYYWFEQYGGRVAWDFAAKLALLRDGVKHGRTDGALVRLATPLAVGEDATEADARILSLLTPALDPLARFVPRAASAP